MMEACLVDIFAFCCGTGNGAANEAAKIDFCLPESHFKLLLKQEMLDFWQKY